jgi:hypothetical protein
MHLDGAGRFPITSCFAKKQRKSKDTPARHTAINRKSGSVASEG